MAELKTKPNDADVQAFLDSVENPVRRADAQTLCAMMSRITGERPRMWGASIVGFGRYRYTNTRGDDHGWFLTGFSPRKANLVCYIMPGFARFDALTARLGKHKTGKSCLYINKLADIDPEVLEQMIAASVAWMRKTYTTG